MSNVRDVSLRDVEGAQALDVEPPSPAPSVARTLDDLGLDGAIVDNLLSADECARLVRACDDAGFAYWDPAGANDDNRRVRDAQTVEFCDRELCAAIWERLRPFLPASSCVEREQPRWQPDLDGQWHARGLNPHLLVNRYTEGGHFSPHADGSTEVSFDERSLYTVLLYLNDVADGGATQLLRDPQDASASELVDGIARAVPDLVLHSVQPRAGRALIYWHQTMHASQTLGASCTKYCLRTDVMYERVPRKCTADADLEAYSLYQRACRLEASGNAVDALPLYMRCAKLSPGVVGWAYGLR